MIGTFTGWWLHGVSEPVVHRRRVCAKIAYTDASMAEVCRLYTCQLGYPSSIEAADLLCRGRMKRELAVAPTLKS